MARFLVSGGLLGLTLSGLVVGRTSEAAEEPVPSDPKPPVCERYHSEVFIDFRDNGIHFHPDRCLHKGGRAWFINDCGDEVFIKVDGPEWEFVPPLPPHEKESLCFRTGGVYTIHAAEGCSKLPDDRRLGTLEVGSSGGGEDPIPFCDF
ncbi:hypothetical protein HPC49_50035 [Pyxidicoccus fallax]|uniref:Uncharacterized protein n=1 Tax=Pyxidicoccus fallax TaxID=394095 RepID=A0A848LZZ5_9BACT|nr:hypothetical protein [Pyxidicoccus fallax]NMO22714.1 hypothetical protein [Pyxidicoccus fallax]NPC86314.1 hypothetical protein [Pyxidicoccus fallax]